MQLLRKSRLVLLALLLTLVPASSFAGVLTASALLRRCFPFIRSRSARSPGGVDPRLLNYGPEGYYRVPGAWVPAPYEGALWTRLIGLF